MESIKVFRLEIYRKGVTKPYFDFYKNWYVPAETETKAHEKLAKHLAEYGAPESYGVFLKEGEMLVLKE